MFISRLIYHYRAIWSGDTL